MTLQRRRIVRSASLRLTYIHQCDCDSENSRSASRGRIRYLRGKVKKERLQKSVQISRHDRSLACCRVLPPIVLPTDLSQSITCCTERPSARAEARPDARCRLAITCSLAAGTPDHAKFQLGFLGSIIIKLPGSKNMPSGFHRLRARCTV